AVTLDYVIYMDEGKNNPIDGNGGTVAVFDADGTDIEKRFYYAISPAIYSGNYTDILTFSISAKIFP
ncbi:MAG: hypothetical protein GX851_06235, partial [Clostridiales bacterium]|nr:hypothetical protein [Clostridiales bacterium]